MESIIFLALAILIAIIVVLAGVKVVPQSETRVIERLGRFHSVLPPGLNIIWPFIDKPKVIYTRRVESAYGGRTIVRMTATSSIDLREQVYDFPSQQVITKDNVTTEINALLYFQIVDPKKSVYEIDNLPNAIEKLTQTSLRNVIGELELDETLTSRDTINSKITAILDEATDKWGIKVNRVEVKNIIPPREIQEAMEKQMKAEREKRAVILKADGEKQAAITAAEGEKEAAILRADAVKQQRILEAEGEAQAILAVQKANADAIRLLNEAMPNDKVLALRSLEALAKVANGKATKIIIPSELQNLGGVVPSIKELLTDPKED